MSNTYEVGTRVWSPNEEHGWLASEVTKKSVDGDKVHLVIRLDNGEVSDASTCSERWKMLMPAADEGGRDECLGILEGCHELHPHSFDEPGHA